MRYADLVLLYAEALLRGSAPNEALAKTQINMVRERAAGFNSAYRTVDQLIADESRFTSVLDVLWYERRVEFCMEGDRWFDLVRSGRATADTFSKSKISKSANFDAHDVWLPVSEHDINASTGELTKYPSPDLIR
jgi:hypothetical protein